MTNQGFNIYLQIVAFDKQQNKHIRMGQQYFNTLHDLYPEIANEIRGTVYDPFHNNDVIGSFLSYLHNTYVYSESPTE